MEGQRKLALLELRRGVADGNWQHSGPVLEELEPWKKRNCYEE